MIFWISFADDDDFRGACLIEADDFDDALGKTWALESNPGGEVQATELEDATAENVAPYELNRLYSKADMDDLGGYERF